MEDFFVYDVEEDIDHVVKDYVETPGIHVGTYCGVPWLAFSELVTVYNPIFVPLFQLFCFPTFGLCT